MSNNTDTAAVAAAVRMFAVWLVMIYLAWVVTQLALAAGVTVSMGLVAIGVLGIALYGFLVIWQFSQAHFDIAESAADAQEDAE